MTLLFLTFSRHYSLILNLLPHVFILCVSLFYTSLFSFPSPFISVLLKTYHYYPHNPLSTIYLFIYASTSLYLFYSLHFIAFHSRESHYYFTCTCTESTEPYAITFISSAFSYISIYAIDSSAIICSLLFFYPKFTCYHSPS